MMYHWQDNILILSVIVIANAKQDQIIGPVAQGLKIKVHAPAIENKANQRLIKILSELFKVPKSAITLKRGAQSKHKLFAIKDPKILPDWISHEC